MRNLTHSSLRLHYGFSLLELLVVLVLVAIVSGTIVVQWSGVEQGATVDSAVRQLEFWDAHLRRHAQAHGTPCSLLFDLKNHRICKRYHNQSTDKSPSWEALGRNVELQNLESPSIKQRGGQVEVIYSRDGTSQTYGLQLIGPGKRQEWLLFAGVTGQVTRLESEREYQDALQILSPK